MIPTKKLAPLLPATLSLLLSPVFFGTLADADLGKIAAHSLTQNIVQLPSGSYLVAGQHQFKTLWTRDFCFSIRGLLSMNRSDVVRNQLDALIQNRRKTDGLIPRVLDSSPILARVALSSVGIRLPLHDPLRPFYVDEHGSEAIDSNALVLLGALDYRDTQGDYTWWAANETALVEVFHYYASHQRPDGLLVQPAFSDWQDSVRRTGATFYANLLYYRVLSRLADNPMFGIGAEAVSDLKQKIQKIFWDPSRQLYLSIEAQPYLSLEGNLFAIDWGFSDAPNALYASLKASALWQGPASLPGIATVPKYPAKWKSASVRIAGVGGYHDRLYWSWLSAYAAKIAYSQGDAAESARILTALGDMAERDGEIGEVYAPKPGLPEFRSWLYRSEEPFSWGSAFVLDALATIK